MNRADLKNPLDYMRPLCHMIPLTDKTIMGQKIKWLENHIPSNLLMKQIILFDVIFSCSVKLAVSLASALSVCEVSLVAALVARCWVNRFRALSK